MSRTLRRWIVRGLAAAALAGIFLALFERADEAERERRLVGEARSNPLLGARRLLRRLGIDAHTVRGLDAKTIRAGNPQVVMVLFVDPASLPVATGDFETWVAEGGNLVIGLSGRAVPAEQLDDDLGEEAADQATHQRPWLASWQRLSKGLHWREVQSAGPRAETLDLEGRGLDITYRSRVGFLAGAPWQQHGQCVASRRYGEGRLTILCASSMFANRRLGDADHPRLLWELASQDSAARRDNTGSAPAVWLVSGLEYETFFAWLWERVPYGLVGTVLLLLTWLVMAVQRFGHIIDVEVKGRRSIAEHVEASARFQWRQGAGDILLDPLRAEVRRRAARHHPRFRHLNPEERRAALRAVLGADGDEVDAVLAGERRRHWRGAMLAKEFVRQVRVLNRARRAL